MLSNPFYVTKKSDTESEVIGLVVSQSVTPIQQDDGTLKLLSFLTVLWSGEDKTPELVAMEELDWDTVPGYTDGEGDFIDDDADPEETEGEAEPIQETEEGNGEAG